MKYLILMIYSLLSFSTVFAQNNISVDLSVKKVLDMPSAPSYSMQSESNYYYQISQTLKKESKVNVSIQAKDGQQVKVLFNGNAKSGKLSLIWDKDDDEGNLVDSGDYLCVVTIDGIKSEKLISLSPKMINITQIKR